MPRYVTGGSPHTTQTNSQLYDYGGIGSCGKQPKYQEGGHRDKITHAHPPPRGETPPRQEMRSASASAGGQYPRGGAARDQINRSGKQTGPKLTPAVPRQITASKRDAFNLYSGVHESYGRRDKGKIGK
jgi:hypothetical protein